MAHALRSLLSFEAGVHTTVVPQKAGVVLWHGPRDTAAATRRREDNSQRLCSRGRSPGSWQWPCLGARGRILNAGAEAPGVFIDDVGVPSDDNCPSPGLGGRTFVHSLFIRTLLRPSQTASPASLVLSSAPRSRICSLLVYLDRAVLCSPIQHLAFVFQSSAFASCFLLLERLRRFLYNSCVY